MASNEIIDRFKESVTPNLLARDDFIDWTAVDKAIAQANSAVESIEKFRAQGDFTAAALGAALLEFPGIYPILQTLVAFNSSGSQVSKWGLPDFVPPTEVERRQVASQLLYVGLDRPLRGESKIRDMLLIAEIYKDSFRRRFRSGDRVKYEVNVIVSQAIKEAEQELKVPVRATTETVIDQQLRRSLEFVVTIDGRPAVGIVTVFQNQSGGRQQRDLSQTYPNLQRRLNEYGMALVLIADGQGLIDSSDRALSELFDAVRYPMSISQARNGNLVNALIEAADEKPAETIDDAALARLISGLLESRSKVKVEDLPVPKGPGVLALARYVESNRRLDLELSPTGDQLAWRHLQQVDQAKSLALQFDHQKAIDIVLSRLGWRTLRNVQNAFGSTLVATPEVPPFTGKLLLSSSIQVLDQNAIRQINLLSLEIAQSPFSIYLTARDLLPSEVEAHRRRQAVQPVNAIILGPKLIRDISESAGPNKLIIEQILQQSDLTKVSPFILSNATPRRMFYGRDTEAATILATLSTNSVALLGSRRIGKTSLLRKVTTDLQAANFLPFFGDCQTVKTWQDFAQMAQSEWNISIPDAFRPQHLSQLIRELSSQSDKQVVILLDEIDQLLSWDRAHDDESVPEAFFRACRSISQDGLAQFVFSGERTIAQRIWDPQSPHWNFSRPIALAQLTKDALTALIAQPLRSMNIQILDEPAFFEAVWRYTSGHPQIGQFLGDRLVRRLDEKRDRTRLELSSTDVESIAESYEYADHYLTTYWGQSTEIEKAITIILAERPGTLDALFDRFNAASPSVSQDDFVSALRMLQLYGIVQEVDGSFTLRATWFPAALGFFHGSEFQTGG